MMTVREGHREDDLRASCHYSPLQEARETGRNGNDQGRVFCRYYGTLCGEVDIYGHHKTLMYFPNRLQASEHLTSEGPTKHLLLSSKWSQGCAMLAVITMCTWLDSIPWSSVRQAHYTLYIHCDVAREVDAA